MDMTQEAPKGRTAPAASLVDRYWAPSLDAMTHGVSLQDRHHTIVRANSGLGALLQKSADEIIGRKSWSLFYGANRLPQSSPLYGQMHAHGHVQERAALAGLGKVVQVYCDALCDETGRFDGYLCTWLDVTAAEQAEEALRESEAKYRQIFENVRDVFYRTDAQGLITDISPSGEQQSGYAREELIGAPIMEMYEDPQAREAFLAELLEKGEVADRELRLRARDGHVVYASATSWVLRDRNGEVVGVEGFLRDITRRKRAEEALKRQHDQLKEIVRERTAELRQTNRRLEREAREREQAEEELRRSEERFSKVFHSAPLPIAITDVQDGRIIDVNDSFLQHQGYRRDEVVGRSTLELGVWVDPEDRVRALKIMSEQGVVRDFGHRIRTKSGEIRHILNSFVEIQVGGKPRLLTMASDVTERKRAEEALRESEKRLASIYDAVRDVIFLLAVEKDGGYRFASVNHAFLSVTGLPAEAVVGKRVNDVIPEPSLTLVLGKYRQAVQKKAVVHWEETSDYPAGRLTGEVSVVPVFDEGGNCTHLVGTVHDITERKRGEEELRQSEKRFRDVLDVSRDFIYKLDLQTRRYDHVSPSVLPMSGFAPEEFAAMGFEGVYERFHPEDRERLRGLIESFLNNTLEEDSVTTIEYRWKKKTGEYYWLSDSGVLIRDSDGKPVALVGSARDVTAQKQAEAALRESEQRFRQVLDVSSDMIYKLDLQSDTFDYISPSVLEMTGFTREEFIALGPRGLRRRIHPEDWPDIRRGSEEFVELGSHPSFEYRLQRKEGEYRWLSDNRSLVRGEDGRPLALVGSVRDVTEGKLAEEELQESLRLLRDTGEMAKVGGWELDLSTEKVSWTEEVARIHGVEPGYEPKLEEALDFYAPESRPAVEATVKRAAETGEPYDLESLFIPLGSKDKIWVRSLGKAVYSGGRIVKLTGTFQNIDKYKRADEALRESEERFRTLATAAPIGIFLMDDKGQVVYTNERLQAIAEVSPGGGPMEQLATAVHPDDRERVLAEWAKAARKTAELSQEYRILAPQGETRWVRMRVCPMFFADGRQSGVVGTVEDTTERKQAEERAHQLRAEQVRAAELRRMVRVLEQMAATLSHELRNPLGVISNSAYFLGNQARISDPKAQKHVAIIEREVTSAKTVIEDILEFAHMPQLVPAACSINAVVTQAVERAQIPASIRVTRRLGVDLPPVVCDEERLERVFLNIITNAVQAMPHGGRLGVRTHQSPDGVEIVFADDGEGIAPENLDRLFEPMFTTKLRGIGLGLTVVRRTIEQHGGEISVKSRLGKGTTFTVALPRDVGPPNAGD